MYTNNNPDGISSVSRCLVCTVGPCSMIQQQWDVNDHFTISNYRTAKTLQGVNNQSINQSTILCCAQCPFACM